MFRPRNTTRIWCYSHPSFTFIRRHSAKPFQFTLSAPNDISKQTFLNALQKHQPRPSSTNGLVVLTTHSLATWLEDEAFMSSIISLLTGSPASGNVGIVSAVVDGLLTAEGVPSATGISVLGGDLDSLVPGISSQPQSQDSSSTPGSISFSLGTHQKVTLALSNTIFQNGKSSTLFTSQYKSQNGQLKLQNISSTNSISITYPTPSSISYSVPLVPITPLRPIVSSFGNIIRQVELQGTPVPASKELEAIIPKIVAARGPSVGLGPMAVWALVIPPDANVDESPPLPLSESGSFDPEREIEIVRRSSPIISSFLNSGYRLHQLLSGGGGWGKKQGLLALDPEIRPDSSSEEGEMLMQSLPSLSALGGIGGPSSIIRPGSSVQFLVTPLSTPPTGWDGAQTAKTIFGISQMDENGDLANSTTTNIEYRTTFGALARQIFVQTTTDAQTSSKLNVPHALLRL